MPSLRGGLPDPPWTGNGNNVPPSLNELSPLCRKRLISISTKLHGVYVAMLNEVRSGLDASRKELRFDDLELKRATDPVSVSFGINLAESPDGTALLSSLADDSYLDIWQKVADVLLEYQGRAELWHHPSWHQTKQRARYFLDARSMILRLFKDIEDEILTHRADVYRGISGKLSLLKMFLVVYDRQPYLHYGRQRPEPVYAPREREKSVVADAYPRMEQNGKRTLFAVVCLVVVVSIIPIALAVRNATNMPGTIDNMDFWLLVQSSTLQLLGLFVSIFPIYRRSATGGWIWTWVFTTLGTICTIIAIPLYLHVPTIWSSLLSFLGSVTQAFLGVQLALLADYSPPEVKRGRQEDTDQSHEEDSGGNTTEAAGREHTIATGVSQRRPRQQES